MKVFCSNAIIEERRFGFEPDVKLSSGGLVTAVEIAVSSFAKDEKIEFFAKEGWSALEIAIPDCIDRQQPDLELLRQILVEDGDYKYWLMPSGASDRFIKFNDGGSKGFICPPSLNRCPDPFGGKDYWTEKRTGFNGAKFWIFHFADGGMVVNEKRSPRTGRRTAQFEHAVFDLQKAFQGRFRGDKGWSFQASNTEGVVEVLRRNSLFRGIVCHEIPRIFEANFDVAGRR